MLEEGQFGIYELYGLFAPVCQHSHVKRGEMECFMVTIVRIRMRGRDPQQEEVLNAVAQAS